MQVGCGQKRGWQGDGSDWFDADTAGAKGHRPGCLHLKIEKGARGEGGGTETLRAWGDMPGFPGVCPDGDLFLEASRYRRVGILKPVGRTALAVCCAPAKS